jgi:hypothetical protein
MLTPQQTKMVNHAILDHTDEWGRGLIFPCKNKKRFDMSDFTQYGNLVMFWFNDSYNSTHVVKVEEINGD